MNKVLDDVKVVGFTFGAAGPLTTSILAAYGATVITIESRKRLDFSRQTLPFIGNVSSPDRALTYLLVNTGKQAVTLNLKHPASRRLVERIVQWADVVVESFAGGVMASLGLAYEDLSKIKPDIIMVSEAIFGQTGPWTHLPGYGTPLTSATGFPHLTGFPDQSPQLPGRAFTDYITPRAAVLSLVAALDHRRRTGEGQYVDVSQLEAAIPFLTPLLLDYQVNGRELGRMGNRSTCAAPHGVYRCKGDDKWCAITVFGDEQWDSFCQVLGRPAWTRNREFGTLLGRLDNNDRLDKLVETWTVTRTPQEVTDLLQAAGIAAGAMQAGEELGSDPQLRHRGFFWKMGNPETGTLEYSGMPARMSRTPYTMSPAPALGQHNEPVFTEIAGLSDEEFVRCLEEGVLE